MKPNRTETIDGHTVEEFYWAGQRVVYVDHHMTTLSFEEIVAQIKAKRLWVQDTEDNQ